MTRIGTLVLGMLLSTSFLPGGEVDLATPRSCTTCGQETYGTAVQWAGSPAEAARRARAEEKLVFVLHVSGHFEDPAFT